MAKKGLGSALRALFSRGGITEEVLEELEDLLIEGDINARTAMEIVAEVEKYADAKENAVSRIREMLSEDIITEELSIDPDKLNLFLMLGVNGVGKTTSLAKLSRYYADQEQVSSIMVAADTFRAAAIDQLEEHGRRLKVRVVRQNSGADPGAVVYDGIESAKNNNIPLVLVDTAGRMHTKANLVRELQKIHKVIQGRIGDGNYRKLLVIDATTGQNGLRQAEMFHEAVGLDGVVLAKYDSASKGGVVISICRELGIPFVFMGTGEKYGDIEPFNREHFLDILLSDG